MLKNNLKTMIYYFEHTDDYINKYKFYYVNEEENFCEIIPIYDTNNRVFDLEIEKNESLIKSIGISKLLNYNFLYEPSGENEKFKEVKRQSLMLCNTIDKLNDNILKMREEITTLKKELKK